MQQIVQWFDLGGEIQARRQRRQPRTCCENSRHSGPDGEDQRKLDVGPKDAPEIRVSAAEFILEGLHAHKRIGRSEERVFTAGEKQPQAAKNASNRKSRRMRGRSGRLTN